MISLFASAPKGLEELLVEELHGLGIADARPGHSGVRLVTDLAGAYKALLWSRVANRIYWPLMQFDCFNEAQLYDALLKYDWFSQMDLSSSFSFEVDLLGSPFKNSHFLRLKAKDALVDAFRAQTGERPTVDLEAPDLRFHLLLDGRTGLLSLDLAGAPLSHRGYRKMSVEAPLRENLAAGLLLRARWPEMAKEGKALLDPFCGSGTLLIEGAMIALNAAPGLLRERWGFSQWKKHDPALWDELIDHAESVEIHDYPPPIYGWDQSTGAISAARSNLLSAGLPDCVTFEQRAFKDFALPKDLIDLGGLIATNPPYGERIGDTEVLKPLYRQIGQRLTTDAPGFELAMLTGSPELGLEMGIKAKRQHKFYNGAIECRLLRFDLGTAPVFERKPPGRLPLPEREPAEESEAFTNRLKKNLKKFEPWAKKEGTEAYRIYDRDLPEYNLTIDRYGSHLHLSEWSPPKELDPHVAKKRLQDVLLRLIKDFDYKPAQLHLKRRQRQKGKEQYEKREIEPCIRSVIEGGLRFKVNLESYLDTGLFLDHRSTRAMIKKMAAGKRFLNLFCYTGAVTVYAAAGGAKGSVSVDLNQGYLDWAAENLEHNGLNTKSHVLLREDVLQWIEQDRNQYDLIFCDPPTFSNSKSMRDSFDVQSAHVRLIHTCMKRLAKGGTLIFSNNFRDFKLEYDALSSFEIEDITARTLPKDFERSPKIHHCYLITRP
ncbi:MAG: bifunctional 23S rRNA (guanine(2069)-N(7))-methyltransferase RlmK/23S rRNA (guanine(2445)-N(2))-methyltransferase RlmL [bacterium]|nr:bifunctional 23S rRNA (guanine(2069)-N(7))-methyltransferase RlmK/23S rRNA (guanine(2445)-N(2))-methyltransferase RlmL [bacterium]